MNREREIISVRGRNKFVSDGFSYTFDKLSKDGLTSFWRCTNKDECKARLHTRNNEVVKLLNVHNHDASASSIEAAEIVTRIKARAVNTQECTSQVINECITGISQAAMASLPQLGALKKTVRRKRNEVNAAPPAPLNLQTLQIPDEFKMYAFDNGIEENFLLYDSGPEEMRILIFGRRQNLHILRSSDTFYGDGTFKTAPHLFSQIYTILGRLHGGVHPIIYALLPNKQGATYVRLFRALIELEPNFQPRSYSCDFEAAAITAFQGCFPDANIFGCYYHLTHNVKKKICELGLIQNYNNDANFSLRAKMVPALAFVPINDLENALDAISEALPDDLQPLVDWFEDNYIGRRNRRGLGRRPALFGPETWNLHQRVLDGEDRTNNYAEAAHRRLTIELGMEHPTIWKFIVALRKIQIARDVRYEQLLAGHQPSPKKRKYREIDNRISRLILNYNNDNILEFLRGIAHNYELH
ncbi:hypothetical protein PPYR_05047 [Photinus pyralis]|nr:uncharacterized protein LOC116159292 [Photinus pyralis]KAB0802861.1 hypothetical protein PPYR_05047 [Photinus pyralis]